MAEKEKNDIEQRKFERTMTALFQVPKKQVVRKIKKKAKKGKD